MRWIVLTTALLVGGCSLPRWPVEGRVTSPFGLRWDGIRPEIHRGVDLSVPTGTPVRAMAAGRVRYAGWRNGYGLLVVLDHGGGVASLYAHLSELRVEAGEQVDGQAVIALSGATGNATAPHLHFEIRRSEQAEDPVPLLGGAPYATISAAVPSHAMLSGTVPP